MSNNFFTSDFHIFHKKIKEYCPTTRVGDTPEQMVEHLLSNIERQVRPGDSLYNLGDVSFGTHEQTRSFLARIKQMGVHHHLVLGNHDIAIRDSAELQALFTTVSDIKTVKIGKNTVVMCHYPFAVWPYRHYGSWHLHGHSHGGFKQLGKCMDVGVDTCPNRNMTMWSYEEILKIMKTHGITPPNHG